MVDETQGRGGVRTPSGESSGGSGGPGAGAGGTGGTRGASEPVVEDNGPWWGVFLVTFIFLFASAFAFLVHSLLVTFD